MKILLLSLFTIFAFTHCGDDDASADSSKKPEADQPPAETALAHCVDGSYEIQADLFWNYYPDSKAYRVNIASSNKTIFVQLKQKVIVGETAQVTCSEFDRKDEKTLQARVLKKAKTNNENFTSGVSDLSFEVQTDGKCKLSIQFVNPNDSSDKDVLGSNNIKTIPTAGGYETLKKECDALEEIKKENTEETEQNTEETEQNTEETEENTEEEETEQNTAE